MDDIDLRQIVTLVIHHRVSASHLPEYEAWLQRIVSTAASYQGHLGVNVIRPSSDSTDKVFTSVLRFSSEADMQRWLQSSDRLRLIEEVSPMLMDGDQLYIHRDSQFWFTPPEVGAVSPPLWKQALLTCWVIYPLTLLLPWLWHPAFARWPWLGSYFVSNLVITLCIVTLVVYLIMPRVTRWFSAWLKA